MRIHLNDLCPFGSDKSIGNCCMNDNAKQISKIGTLPTDVVEEAAEFIATGLLGVNSLVKSKAKEL